MNPLEERIYNLSSVGLKEKANLIIGEEKYIETEDNIFSFKDLNSFKVEDKKIFLTNEEGDKFYFESEQFEIIKDLIL